ncbi:polysaccharide polymerase [Curvibacter sp. APW13]|uniref:polysaccharide polymerase n=1 Tax=Curvibacter sp. APW13 TaxID=3077236 RepID=UPI0028DD6533|nr:polysaccharide polymerase [Curvibacter sp. APW13]MDT8992592.1 polysaccharide polymerase [Curvibacter sp. APW13]
MLIPLLFIGLGMQNGSVKFADRVLTLIVLIVVAVAIFEAAFLDIYGRIFNPLSFYGNIGGIRESAAMYGGQTLTLNGFRPEGIGRTLLPMVLGVHRTSSTMMEPVSLGNLGVILLAWGLTKPRKEMLQYPVFLLSAALLIVLADSRFGLVMGLVFFIARILPLAVVRRLAPVSPVMILACVLLITLQTSAVSDDILGRVRQSGTALLHFDALMSLGLRGPLPGFGDMGFAYVISRFGIPVCMLLTFGLFLVPMADTRGQWFRAFVVLYIFSNLAISGTSIFALKTAGILWFLFGVLSVGERNAQSAESDRSRLDGIANQNPKSAFFQPGYISAGSTDAGYRMRPP